MSEDKNIEVSERREYFEEKFKNKVWFAGSKHSRVKQILALANNKKSNPKKYVIIEGLWAHEVIRDNKTKIEAFLFCPELIYTPEAEAMTEYFVKHSASAYIISKKTFLKIAEKENSNGIVSICYLPQSSFNNIEIDLTKPVVILDGIEIPGNIGTIIRTCDGAGAAGVIICNQRARLTHPRLIRSSHGANFRIPIVEASVAETLEWLDKHSYTLLLTDTSAKKVYSDIDYNSKTAIVAGSERYGISKEWYRKSSRKVMIPMLGECDSLNVAVSTAIILYEVALQLKALQ